MKSPSPNLLGNPQARRKLKKHVRDLIGQLTRDGVSVVGLYHRSAGHYDVEVETPAGSAVRVGLAGTPGDRNAVKHTYRAALRAAGR
jgi:hypothetical protein